MNNAVTSGSVNCDGVGVPSAIQARTVFFVFAVLEYIAAVIEDGASYACETWWLTCSAVKEYSAEGGDCDSQEGVTPVPWTGKKQLKGRKFSSGSRSLLPRRPGWTDKNLILFAWPAEVRATR